MTPSRFLTRVAHQLLSALFVACAAGSAWLFAAPRQMEALGRGVVAVAPGGGSNYVGWRLLGTDPAGIAFNVYRSADGAVPVKLNAAPLTVTTDYVDSGANAAATNLYFVRAVIGGIEQPASLGFTLPANPAAKQYLSIPLTPPTGGTTPDGVAFTYSANDCSAADLDGDGEYELVLKWDPSNAKDNSQDGYTGNVFLDAYKLNGLRLWRIDLGRNIRAGAHYTQFMVYDLDGDGRAELACKTAPGTRDANGTAVLLGSDSADADYRNASGYVLSGPEYLTIFDGLTGSALATTAYNPPRGTVSSWGDNYGNRVDRFLAGVAYLDGTRPSLVLCRGYYTRAVLAAWDWRDGALIPRWVFDTGHTGTSNSYAAWRGQGAHSLTIGDVDGDGRDEIVYGAAAIDDDGTGLYSTALGHGDALHLSDMDPDRPGQEVWMVHEDPGSYGASGLEFRAAGTGALLFGVSGGGSDVGRGVAFDIDPRHRGYEMWGSRGGLMTASGTQVSASRPSSMNFAAWWDADPLREILDSNYVDKWNWTAGTTTRLLTATGCSSNNGTKATPALSADLFGDWREEIVWRTSDSAELRVFTTTIPATSRLVTLMHDSQYRLAIAWQNTAYNQPPHPSFYLGDGMSAPPAPEIAPPGTVVESRLAALSVRTTAGSGDQTLVVGFVLQGTGTRNVLVRSVGPTLGTFGLSGAMADPKVTLYTGPTATAVNDDWSSSANADALQAAFAGLGAFALPRPSKDAALLAPFSAGLYSAHATAATGANGVTLVELYDAGGSADTRFAAIAARAPAGTGEATLVVGFVITGTTNRTLLIRATGPELTTYGLSPGTVLADPQLAVYRNGVRLEGNNDWVAGSGATAQTFSDLGAFPYVPSGKDAALLVRLPPGVYTAHATGAAGGSGVALVEVYDLGY